MRGGAALRRTDAPLRKCERGVIFRFGRMIGTKGPGLIILIPVVDRMVGMSLRTIVLDVPPRTSSPATTSR